MVAMSITAMRKGLRVSHTRKALRGTQELYCFGVPQLQSTKHQSCRVNFAVCMSAKHQIIFSNSRYDKQKNKEVKVSVNCRWRTACWFGQNRAWTMFRFRRL